MKISLQSYFLVLSNMQKNKTQQIEPFLNRMHAAEQMLVLDKFNQFIFYGYFCDFPIKKRPSWIWPGWQQGQQAIFFAHISYIIGPFWGSSLQVKKENQRFDLDAHINKSFKNLLLRDTKRIIEELSIHGHHTLKKKKIC